MSFPSVVRPSGETLDADFFLATFAPVAGVILLAVLLPFAVSLVLDGLVLVLRGRGLMGLVIAALLSTAIGVVGAVAMQIGRNPEAMDASLALLLPWSCALAMVAFVVRQIRAFSPASR